MRRVGLGLALLGLVGLASEADGLSLISATRCVGADAAILLEGLEADVDGVELCSVDAGPFVRELALVVGSSFSDFGEGVATQNTVIEPPDGSLEAFGDGGAGAAVDLFDPGFDSWAAGVGVSSFELTFSVHAPTAFAFWGLLSADLFSSAGSVLPLVEAAFELSGASSGIMASGSVVDTTPDGLPIEQDFHVEGVLAPDIYTLEVFAAVDLFGLEDAFAAGIAVYTFDFVAPEPTPALLLTAGLLGIALTARRTRAQARIRVDGGRRPSARAQRH